MPIEAARVVATCSELPISWETLSAAGRNRIVQDADPVSVGQVLETSFGGALAVELDRVSLKGSGTAPEPRGIRNQSDVSVNATAAAASWAVIAERVGVLVGANVPIESIGVAVNPVQLDDDHGAG